MRPVRPGRRALRARLATGGSTSTRPRPGRRRATGAGGVLVRVGRAAERAVGVTIGDRPDAASSADVERSRVRGSVVLGALALSVVARPVAAVVLLVGWHLPALLERRTQARLARSLSEELLVATELLAVAARAGASVAQAVEAVAPRVPGRLGEALGEVTPSCRRGVPLDAALAEVVAGLGQPVAPLVAILRAAHLDGEPLSPALRSLADRLRDARRRQVEAEARRLAVRMLVPLVCCILPAFALECVVPVVVEAVRGAG